MHFKSKNKKSQTLPTEPAKNIQFTGIQIYFHELKILDSSLKPIVHLREMENLQKVSTERSEGLRQK